MLFSLHHSYNLLFPTFKFRLSDIEVETLKKNIEFARKIIDVEFINPQQQIEGTWLWTKPSIDI